MTNYTVQPLDLMQFINTKYHEPFIHELIEFDKLPDMKRFKNSLDKLIDNFPLLKSYYDEKNK